MRFLITLVALLLSSASGAVAQELSTEDERILLLIEQLNDEAFTKRQTALHELRSIGMPAIPHLREVLSAKNPEVVFRARLLIPVIQGDHVLSPTLITLSARNQEARLVFAELSRQADTPIYFSTEEGAAFNNTPIDVDFDRVPFWEAFLATCRLSNNTCYDVAGPEVRLRAGQDGLALCTSVGPLLVKFDRMYLSSRSRPEFRTPQGDRRSEEPILLIQFVVICEGKLLIRRFRGGRIHSGLTDAGRLRNYLYFSEATTIRESLSEGADWFCNSVDAVVPADDAKVISSIRISFELLIVTETLPELTEVTGQEFWRTVSFSLHDLPISR